jgi:hypothetical protein
VSDGGHASASGPGTRRVSIALFLACAALYILPHRYHGSGDTRPAELLPIAVLHGHGFDLSEFVDRGSRLPYYFDLRKGRIVSAYPVLPGILNLPVYFTASLFHVDLVRERSRLSLLTSAIVTALSVVFLFHALRSLMSDPRLAVAFALLYAFGTNAWSNGAIALFQHGASLLFLSGAFACLASEDETKTPWAGLFLGLAVVNRPANLMFAIPLAVFVLRHRRASIWPFLVLAAIPGALLAIYSEIYWGSVRALGQGQGGWGFDGKPLRSLSGLLVSPSRGIMIFTPVFVFSLAYGFQILFRRQGEPLLRYLFGGALLTLALYSKWGAWWGGHSYSYRLLTELCPALILLLAACWRDWIRVRPLRRAAFYGAAAISILLQPLGVWAYPTKFNDEIDFETWRLWDWKRSEPVFGLTKELRRYGVPVREPEPVHAPPRPPQPEGWFFEPQKGAVFHGGTVRGSGWAASDDGVARVEWLDGRNIGTATYGEPGRSVDGQTLRDVPRPVWLLLPDRSRGSGSTRARHAIRRQERRHGDATGRRDPGPVGGVR